MVEPANTRVAASNSGGVEGKSAARSFVAMVLSAILPGLGQLYLGQFPKAIVLFCHFCFCNWCFLPEFTAGNRMA